MRTIRQSRVQGCSASSKHSNTDAVVVTLYEPEDDNRHCALFNWPTRSTSSATLFTPSDTRFGDAGPPTRGATRDFSAPFGG